MNCHNERERFTEGKLWLVMIMLLATLSVAQDQQWLLGDWNGQRTSLAKKGFEFEFVLTLEGVQNVTGGIARSSRGLTNLDLIMDAEGQALGLWENGDFHLYVLSNTGGEPTEMIGDLQTSSNIEAPDTFKVYEAWWRQRYADDRLAWLLGLHDYNALFNSLDTAGLFTNSSFGISPDISQVPPSIFPTTSLAFLVSLFPGHNSYVHVGAYDGGPGDPMHPRGTHIILDHDDGIFYAVEGGVHNEETGTKLGGGAWYRTTNFDSEFNGQSYGNNRGVYLIGETSLAENWAGFFQLGRADQYRNQVGQYAGAGVARSAVWAQDDILGLALAYARNSDEYLNFNPGMDAYEMAVECTYEFHPAPWLTVQPDVQWIKNPGMDPGLDDAVALSLRAYISF